MPFDIFLPENANARRELDTGVGAIKTKLEGYGYPSEQIREMLTALRDVTNEDKSGDPENYMPIGPADANLFIRKSEGWGGAIPGAAPRHLGEIYNDLQAAKNNAKGRLATNNGVAVARIDEILEEVHHIGGYGNQALSNAIISIGAPAPAAPPAPGIHNSYFDRIPGDDGYSHTKRVARNAMMNDKYDADIASDMAFITAQKADLRFRKKLERIESGEESEKSKGMKRGALIGLVTALIISLLGFLGGPLGFAITLGVLLPVFTIGGATAGYFAGKQKDNAGEITFAKAFRQKMDGAYHDKENNIRSEMPETLGANRTMRSGQSVHGSNTEYFTNAIIGNAQKRPLMAEKNGDSGLDPVTELDPAKTKDWRERRHDAKDDISRGR